MPFRTNIQPKPLPKEDWVAWPYIDTLYDYVDFIDNNDPIANLPQHLIGTEVAIVGAGVAGLVAAYELLKIGAKPVVFEATDRIGGRAYSLKFKNSNAIAEMGSMRFPPSGKLLFHYFDLFELEAGGQFPDPGQVLTKLYYENEIINWLKGETAPENLDFKRIGVDWQKFVQTLVQPLYSVWKKEDWEAVQSIWQSYIHKYKDVSFYDGVRQGIPQWSDEDMNKFGALGIGSGGFGPLYQVSFLELLRIIVNMWEDKQKFLPGGISQLTEHFYTRCVIQPDGTQTSLKDIDAIRTNAPVSRIDCSTGEPTLYYRENGQQQSRSFKAVIVATSTRAMEMMGMTLNSPSDSDEQKEIAQSVKVAIRNLHLMDSSKMFVLTPTKFWQNSNIPQNIQTDELPRGVYALDYPDTENGVVLISYTWGDDSSKLLGLQDKMRRFELFKDAIAKISPEFAAGLGNPSEDEILNIDWEAKPYYYGAFKLQYPGQEPNIHAAYYQFLSDPDYGTYLAGDSISWSGGWTEGALQTGINAACAAAKRIGATVRANSPLTQNPDLYNYGDRAYRTVEPVPNLPLSISFDDTEAAKTQGFPITKLIVRAGDIIDCLQAFYHNTALSPHGGAGGQEHTIEIEPGDYLREVSGYYGWWYGRQYILQISFKTRRGKSFGPYGTMDASSEQTPFAFTAGEGEQILAFSGSLVPGLETGNAATVYVNALGVTIQTS
ncbi:FAD-dependent oxidoreductase [Lusitaniella coriacea]|uniref:FAD-dependent oxidoreductase n=1 Tax=Lusitaniella coriacea TaxID=1983105 RepID=UPI003CECED9B